MPVCQIEFPFLELSDNNFGPAISIPMKNIGLSAYKQFAHIQKVLTMNLIAKIKFITDVDTIS